jgi:hypothetical protein
MTLWIYIRQVLGVKSGQNTDGLSWLETSITFLSLFRRCWKNTSKFREGLQISLFQSIIIELLYDGLINEILRITELQKIREIFSLAGTPLGSLDKDKHKVHTLPTGAFVIAI